MPMAALTTLIAGGHVLHAARDFEGARASFEAALERDGGARQPRADAQ